MKAHQTVFMTAKNFITTGIIHPLAAAQKRSIAITLHATSAI